MPANEFEKQVQNQLKEFQLSPSASVWEKVEEQIREKRRRRIIFFFILPVTLGLIGFSFYQFLYTGKKTGTPQTSATVKTGTLLPADQTNTVLQTNDQRDTPDGQISTSKTPGINDNDIAVKAEKKREQKTITEQTGDKRISVTSSSALREDKSVLANKNNSTRKLEKQNDNSLVISVDPGSVKQTGKAADIPSQPKDVVAADDTDAKKNQTEGITNVAEEILPVKEDNATAADSVVAEDKKEDTPVRISKKSKLKWGIDFSAGAAFNNEGIIKFPSAQSFDFNYNPGSVTGVPPGAVIIPPSPVRSGPAFRLGLIAEWQVSKRSRFSAGLQYAYSSNRIKVGIATDTSFTLLSNSNNFSSRLDLEKVYRGTQKNNYTNSYHFIQLPVSYHWLINKSKNLPLQWNAGLSIGYMIKTNALVYSGALGGIYYEDKDVFNKVHFNLNTGFSLRLKARNSSEWVIGPEVSFDMSRLVKGDNKQYLMFGGINAKFLLPKKKNK